jgi:hypothetical protein
MTDASDNNLRWGIVLISTITRMGLFSDRGYARLNNGDLGFRKDEVQNRRYWISSIIQLENTYPENNITCFIPQPDHTPWA